MRKVIYITGITASGKTTNAMKLALHLGLPFFKADDVYSMIARELNYDHPERLVLPEHWSEFPKFGLLKLKYYRKLLEEVDGDFIIEGFPLFFEQDRQLIKQVIGEHSSTFFRFNLDFETWKKYAEMKFGGLHSEKDFTTLNRYFENPGFHYEIKDPGILFVHYEKYQRIGFTDKKWELLDLGQDSLPGKSVIDLGCNEGWIGKNCLDIGASPVFGVDYNWRYLELARSSGLNVELADLDSFNFKQQFDIVICLAVFHYVRDKERLIEKIAANTKELFILEVPINSNEDKSLSLHDTGKCQYYIPSFHLVEHWILKYFSRFEYKESIAPDNSRRLVFKCYK